MFETYMMYTYPLPLLKKNRRGLDEFRGYINPYNPRNPRLNIYF